jgi:hypothetical protein
MRLPQILMISFKDYYYQVLFSKSSGVLLDWQGISSIIPHNSKD